MDYRTRYMDLLLHAVIRLAEGESLAINANPSHLDFARDLAQRASEITRQPVHVVSISEGIPGDVTSMTCVLSDPLASAPVRGLLLRIDDTEDRQWEVPGTPEEKLGDLALLQKTGNLAPPQLNKPVAPWAVIAVPGPRWAKRVLGPHATEEDLWELFARMLSLGSANPIQAMQEHLSVLRQRLAFLNRLDLHQIRITGGGNDLTLGMAPQSRWRGGVHTLADGRSFIPYLPPERVSMLTQRDSARGTVCASQPFNLLGTVVQEAKLQLFDGRVTSFEAAEGAHALACTLQADEGASVLSELSLVDLLTPLAAASGHFGHAGFDENRSSSIVLGMGDSGHLEALETYDDESELQRLTGCNVSVVRSRIPVGSSHLCVTGITDEGEEIAIMENGVFKL